MRHSDGDHFERLSERQASGGNGVMLMLNSRSFARLGEAFQGAGNLSRYIGRNVIVDPLVTRLRFEPELLASIG